MEVFNDKIMTPMGQKGIKRIVSGFLDTNMFFFEEENHLLIIDPNDNEEALILYSSAASVTVLLTHEHFDHICGLNKLRDICFARFNFPSVSKSNNAVFSVIASEPCSERIRNERTNLSAYADVIAELGGKQISYHWEPFTCASVDIAFSKSYSFHWRGHSVDFYYTPGHSTGSSCIFVDDMLFVGDTILENELMVKFPGSSKKQYREVTVPILEKLLVKTTVVYPGHGDVMTPDVALRLIRNV